MDGCAGQDGVTERWTRCQLDYIPLSTGDEGPDDMARRERQEVENDMRYRTNECSEKSESPSRKVGLFSRDYECAGGYQDSNGPA
jgi:hypothetical protein